MVVNEGKLAMEVVAGLMALVMAGVASATGYDVTGWRFAIAGTAGIAGAFCFFHGMSEKNKIVAILIGGAMGSLFGPGLANGAAYELEWVPAGNYFIDAACGFVGGLFSTPVLRFVRNPIPALTFAMSLLPTFGWGKKKDGGGPSA